MTGLRELVPLLGEINDWKRLRTAVSERSLMERLFSRAWAALLDGRDVQRVALATAADAVAGVRLGGIDHNALRQAGVEEDEIRAIRERSFLAVGSQLGDDLTSGLRMELPDAAGEAPFVRALCEQPRAGATSPGRARLVLWPPESHGDHCGAVAIYAVLLAPVFGASREGPFLAGLAHHLHNAVLPDGGFTGEEMLGDRLPAVAETLRNRVLAEMPERLRALACEALRRTGDPALAEGRTFQAADVIDRVLQMRWYEQAAQFRLRTAMEDLELVHAGPVQQLQMEILREAGLW